MAVLVGLDCVDGWFEELEQLQDQKDDQSCRSIKIPARKQAHRKS